MRRPVKIDNGIKKRFAREEKKRLVGTKSRRLYFLILAKDNSLRNLHGRTILTRILV